MVPAERGPAYRPGMARIVMVGQGLYYLATGVLPFISMRTFVAITGPKRDLWLVRTVGLLVSVIGAVLVISGLRRERRSEMQLLAAGSALGLAGIDVFYASKGRISRVYLLDAAAEGAIVAALGAASRD